MTSTSEIFQFLHRSSLYLIWKCSTKTKSIDSKTVSDGFGFNFQKKKETRTSNFELLMEMVRKAINECYEDEANTIKIEITEEGFIDILQGQQEQVSRNGKCLRYCILKSHNLNNIIIKSESNN
uniref:Uncharacterized protein n=1 Tax=Glossina brevipalpis TaxID=37001 RepID=A0A1A9W931_9MUSC